MGLIWYTEKNNEGIIEPRITIKHDGLRFNNIATEKLKLPCKIEIKIQQNKLIIIRHEAHEEQENLLELVPYNTQCYIRHEALEDFFDKYGITRKIHTCTWDKENQKLICDLK